jgi:hypothetical protein
MLVIVLGGNSIVISRRFLREREVALIYVSGTSSDALARAIGAERLIVLLPSRLLMDWPVCIEATTRPLIG